MSLESDIAILREIPLFANLPPEHLRLIAFGAVRLNAGAGQVLFREGSTALSGYVVLGGRVQLTTGEGEGRQIVASAEPGSLIGELALFVETRRPATATAVENSEVLEIERKVVIRLLNEHPDVALHLHALLAERLTETVSELGRVRQALSDPEARAGI